MNVYAVESTTQEDHVVCRVFANRVQADVYASTAREWTARGREGGRIDYRRYFPDDHDPDVVIEKLAASKEWPFSPDQYSEFFSVAEYEVGPHPAMLKGHPGS
jgi:hypothetical protein